jgi:hypothetical protein
MHEMSPLPMASFGFDSDGQKKIISRWQQKASDFHECRPKSSVFGHAFVNCRVIYKLKKHGFGAHSSVICFGSFI